MERGEREADFALLDTTALFFFSYFNAKESTFIAANFAEGPCGFLVFLFTVFELVYFFVWFDLTHLLVQLQLSLVKGQN